MTTDEIKQTLLYKRTLPKVLAIWPDKAEEYAKELSIAISNPGEASFVADTDRIDMAFSWHYTPQGSAPWWELSKLLGER